MSCESDASVARAYWNHESFGRIMHKSGAIQFFLVFKWPITTLSVFEKGYLLKSSSETYLILQLPLCSSKVDLLKKRNYSTKLSKLIFYSLKERSVS